MKRLNFGLEKYRNKSGNRLYIFILQNNFENGYKNFVEELID